MTTPAPVSAPAAPAAAPVAAPAASTTPASGTGGPAPSGASAAPAGPAPGGAPSPAPAGVAQAPQVPQTPSPAAPVTPDFNAAPHLDTYLRSPDKVDAAKFAGEGGAWGPQQMQSYQDALAHQQRVGAFHDGIRQVVGQPMTIGDVTVQFTSESEVHEFMALAKQITSSGATPQQLAQLYWMPKLMQLSGDNAARAYERKVQAAQPAQNPQNPQQPVAPVVPVKSPTSRESADPFGRVPSSREMHKQMFPNDFAQVQAGKKTLFG